MPVKYKKFLVAALFALSAAAGYLGYPIVQQGATAAAAYVSSTETQPLQP